MPLRLSTDSCVPRTGPPQVGKRATCIKCLLIILLTDSHDCLNVKHRVGHAHLLIAGNPSLCQHQASAAEGAFGLLSHSPSVCMIHMYTIWCIVSTLPAPTKPDCSHKSARTCSHIPMLPSCHAKADPYPAAAALFSLGCAGTRPFPLPTGAHLCAVPSQACGSTCP